MQRGFLLSANDRRRKWGTQSNQSKSQPNKNIPPPSPQQQQQQKQQHPHADADSNRRREVSFSQDLITLENLPTEKVPSPLLVQLHGQEHDDHENDDNKPIKPSRPLISVIRDDDDNTTTTTTTTASKSHMEELPIPTQPPLISFMETSSTVNETDEFLFQEKVVTYRSSQGQRVVMEQPTEQSTSFQKSIPTLEAPTLTTTVSNARNTNDSSSTTTIGTPMTLLNFQQMLARMKWTDDESIDMDATVATWTPTQAMWAWQWLLNLDHGKTHLVLVHSLLYHHPWTLPEQLQSNTPQDRAHSLQILKWIQDYLATTKPPRPNSNSHNSWINLSCIDDWLDTILSGLSTLMDHRRTILAQQAWTTSILIIAKFATSLSSVPPRNVLDHLLSIQIQWKQAKTKKSPQSLAQITLLQHWMIQVNQTYHQDPARWRQHILGIRLEHCPGFGGLVHLFCTESLLSERLIGGGDHLFQEVWNLIGSSLRTNDGTTVSILWRGILAHLSTNIKHLYNTTKTQTIDKILDLLPESNNENQSDCELVNAILKLIWSDMDRLSVVELPSHTSRGLSNSMERLWSCCVRHSNVKQQSNTKHSPWDPLFSLLAQCIIQAPDSLAIVNNLLSREGITMSTCPMLCSILTHLEINTTLTIPDNNHYDDCEEVLLQSTKLRDHVQNFIIDNIPTSSLLRAYLSGNDILQVWVAGSLRPWIHKLLQLLYRYNPSTDELSRDIVSTVSSILTKMLQCCIVHQNVEAMVKGVVTFLLTETISSQDSATDFLNGIFCSTFCTEWRVVLLENQDVPDTAFADTVLAIATAIWDHPSSVATLAFFGALMGDHAPSSVVDSMMTFRIMLAMESLLSFCGSKLEENLVQGSDSILTRLSPLLLLRRVPSSYFEIARVHARNLDSSRMQDSSSKVAQYIGSIFELPWANGPEFPVTPEERRLAAEVAGRSFAFGQSIPNHPRQRSTDRPFTTFAWLCYPIFRELIQEVRTSNLIPTQIPLIKRARLALYTACHSIQKGTHQEEEPCNEELYKTTSFAFYAVGIDLTGLVDDVATEIIQLQRGCIEFFAICFTLCLTKVKRDEPTRCRNGSSVAVFEQHESVTDTICDPFDRIWQAVVKILQTDNLRHEDEWICSAEIDYGNIADGVVRKPSVQVRTCLWNALVLVAQRCDDKDGRLAIFADLTLDWIAEWATHQTFPSESNVHHPMCSAAAMQTVFVIATRYKSMDCFRQDGDPSNLVKLHYRWALRELQNAESGKEIGHMLSMAALKLILALLSLVSVVYETGSESIFGLDLEQICDTVKTLQHKLNIDVEEDVRVLSNNILSVLRLQV